MFGNNEADLNVVDNSTLRVVDLRKPNNDFRLEFSSSEVRDKVKEHIENNFRLRASSPVI